MRAVLSNIAHTPRILLAKRTVKRPYAPIELDLEQFSAVDYSKVVPEMKQVEARLLAVPPSHDGLRWIHEAPVANFHGVRTLDYDFDLFVDRVDIGRAGAYYRDSISLEEAVAEKDDVGRVTRQLIRVVALPQPNYSGAFGKGNLDIYKLERLDYSASEQTMWMWTVHSPNRSAFRDDGYLRFSRDANSNSTIVSFLACQHFPYPPLMQASQMHRWSWLRDKLTEDAYRRFFDQMIRNIDDEFNGREYAVGRQPRID